MRHHDCCKAAGRRGAPSATRAAGGRIAGSIGRIVRDAFRPDAFRLHDYRSVSTRLLRAALDRVDREDGRRDR